MSQVVSVRMNKAEAELLEEAAKVYGCGVSSLLKKLAMEKLEDEFDFALVREYETAKRNDKEETYPIELLFDEYGL